MMTVQKFSKANLPTYTLTKILCIACTDRGHKHYQYKVLSVCHKK